MSQDIIKKPKVTTSKAEQELDRAAEQFNEFDAQVKAINLDSARLAPLKEEEPQTKMSAKEIEKSREIYLKPIKWCACKDPFNEKYRTEWENKKEMVRFIAENSEVKGETIDIWTKPFAGVAAMEWLVPVNKPVWGPRYLAEQIRSCQYSQLHTDESKTTGTTEHTSSFGQMVVEKRVNRLNATPVNTSKSIFMGA